MPRYYGVFVDVKDRHCLVFGGDPHEGERKVRYLVDCGANVTLFSPEDETSDDLATMAASGQIDWVRRKYEPGDLAGAWVVIVADTSDAATNEAISQEASERNILLNVMDVTPLCTFIAPALVQRQDVTVAVVHCRNEPCTSETTSGANIGSRVLPMLAVGGHGSDARRCQERREVTKIACDS